MGAKQKQVRRLAEGDCVMLNDGRQAVVVKSRRERDFAIAGGCYYVSVRIADEQFGDFYPGRKRIEMAPELQVKDRSSK